MIEAYRTNNQEKVVEVNEAGNRPPEWLHITKADREEMKGIAQKYAFPLDYLTSAFDPDEVSRSENLEKSDKDRPSLLVLLYPIRIENKAELEFVTRALSIILTDKLLITASEKTPPVIEEIIRNKRQHPVRIKNHTDFVLTVSEYIAREYIQCLKEINRETSKLEANIKKSSKSDSLFKLMKLQKSIVYFDIAIETNHTIFEELRGAERYIKMEENNETLRNVSVEMNQAKKMIRQTHELLEDISDTFSSLISNNLNRTVQFLTTITIILTIPTIISSMWGMNVPVPFEKVSDGFWIMSAIILLLTGLIAYGLKKRDFF
ncbi:magnesium transporter [Alkalibacterium putridalgicola]|uniref:Magnesium transporter n=1 Tax=Alkalibacterium putridalgicola TaxID=426703 RepID=A0A1H7XSC0_9LACT|nr:magnesium transporter CorA family protein [Alkalibacterium putridalgicola]GEK90348.1 magnesium transporter [Alkalibacterium putridalgicola]SEM36027.1 magnesium transporter [Alkalibacterium putridalgicola]